ncbi:MAG: hypothetical protein NTX64_11350 [Elusimicrobia bacterium]|nr:hypothetical protein [Elusimicrobiota bacterium]
MNDKKKDAWVARGSHVWRFFRAGGIDQVDLRRGEDIADLPALDPKLWVALSCPVKGLEFDERTLQLIDTDGDGRVRVTEILAATRWACKLVKDPAILVSGGESLPLAAIEDKDELGALILASARRVLSNIGKPDAPAIGLADTADTARIFGQTNLNGDGVVPPESASDEGVRKLLEEIVKTMGSEADRGGDPGVSRAKADAFFAQCRAFSDWWRAAEQPRPGEPAVLLMGADTPAAYAALQAVRGKVDDYFVRCRLAAFDSRAALPLNHGEKAFEAMAAKELTEKSEDIRSLPLARVEAGRKLPLREGLNPAWHVAMNDFQARVAAPIVGKDSTGVTEEDWRRIQAAFGPYERWLCAKPRGTVEPLGLARVREILAAGGEKTVAGLIDQDLALKPQFEAIEAVERLIRYHRDLGRLLKNFVSFAEFYGRGQAIFQAGRLYVDGRSCDLCIRVVDVAKHGALASASRTFLLYCECSRKDTPEKIMIAAALTGGDSDHIFVGRNGVFYDRLGRDWDATIVKVIEHPISIRQAVWSPYKRLARFLGEQIEKIASARDKAATEKMGAQLEGHVKAIDEGKEPAKEPPFDVAKFAGIFAAIGLAIGGLAAGVGKLVESFTNLLWWQKPLAILGAFAAISGPSTCIAWLKLRQRNLGPLLDANGWAINGRMSINIPFGAALTSVAKLPTDAVRSREDPYAPEKSHAILYGWLVLAVGAAIGLLLWRIGGPAALLSLFGR